MKTKYIALLENGIIRFEDLDKFAKYMAEKRYSKSNNLIAGISLKTGVVYRFGHAKEFYHY